MYGKTILIICGTVLKQVQYFFLTLNYITTVKQYSRTQMHTRKKTGTDFVYTIQIQTKTP